MSLRQWMIAKDGHEFVIRWRAGRENRLLVEIADQVERGELPLSGLDLAILIRMIAESMSQDAPANSVMTNAA